jgi:hypothetical protein
MANGGVRFFGVAARLLLVGGAMDGETELRLYEVCTAAG